MLMGGIWARFGVILVVCWWFQAAVACWFEDLEISEWVLGWAWVGTVWQGWVLGDGILEES